MKKILSVLLCFTFLISCAQKEIKKEDVLNQENIQKVKNIYKEVKKYEYNPTYTLHIEKVSNFTFEALVNDFPVFEEYTPNIISGSKPINTAMLASGKQKLTIRMTPAMDNNYNMAKEIDMDNIELKVSINYGEYGKDNVKDFKEALKYELPKQKGKLPYYEVQLEFSPPTIPYQNDIEGWKNGMDISKEDKDELLKEVEAFYKEMIENYKNKNLSFLAEKYYKRQFEIAQTNYQNKKNDSKIVVDEWIKDVNEASPFIFNQYSMRFFGNGKIVALLKTDKYYINFSALMKEDPVTSDAVVYSMYLYRPKAGAQLEVIR